MMDNQDQTQKKSSLIDQEEEDEEILTSMTHVIEEDTYLLSEKDSTSKEDQGEMNDDSMSEDSLINIEEDSSKNNLPIDSTITSSSPHHNSSTSPRKCHRSITLDDHIKSVQQKKEEVDILRLQKFQEQLRQKEQKWQQQQLVRVKKWLQLRHRDTDHRNQVEERRKKREEETRVKFDEILRREKEREQRTNPQTTSNPRNNAWHKADLVMSISTDILSNRRAISAPRLRSHRSDMTARRASNDSPVSSTFQRDDADQSATANSSHQLNSIDEHRYHRSRQAHDVTMTNEDSSLSGTPRTSATHRSRPMPTSYSFWLNTGDNNNQTNASFMRSTYAASCRARLSRSVERCPRACRAHEEASNNNSGTPSSTTTTVTPNGDAPQRRVKSVTRQQLNETIRRLAKPKNISMAQSIHTGTTGSSSANGVTLSQSSHQLRIPTPPVVTTTTTTNHSPASSVSSSTRRRVHSRPSKATTHQVTSNNDSRTSPSDELTTERSTTSSSIRSSSQRTGTHPKHPPQPSSKPPVSSAFTRPKTPSQRSIMTTSVSSSALSSSPTPNKQNVRRIAGTPPAKPKPKPVVEPTSNTEISTKDPEEETLPVNDDIVESEATTEEVTLSIPPPAEPISTDPADEEVAAATATTTTISKREQQILDEQEYQRKLNQKIREAQQRLEAERKAEEERKRQLELEEYEREQEQIRLEEEQRRVEEERLQRAIEERERENELKRQEEQRLQQQREELERKQAEEAERLNRERQERAKKEEEERNERKRRLDLIMRRTRQVSPTPKSETISTSTTKINTDETNGHDQELSSTSHSTSENRLTTSHSTENFLNDTDSTTPTPETPKFKSPLIQNLLNKARSSRSTDNLIQTSMTTSQILADPEPDEGSTAVTTQIGSSDDEDQQDSGINNTTNGHSDSPLSSSTNLNSYHDHPMERTSAVQ